MVDRWRIVVVDSSQQVVGQVAAFDSLDVVLRWRSPGSWVLTGAAESGLDLLAAQRRVLIYRTTEGQAEQLIVAGPVDRVETDNGPRGRVIVASGSDVLGYMAHRLVLPTPTSAFSSQSAAARYTDTGPAGYVIHRLLTVQAGEGAQHVRQLFDSRVGTQQGNDLEYTGTGWTYSSTGTVMWSGQVASLSASSSFTLATTDAINMADGMVTGIADVELSGFVTCTVTAITNTTAAGATVGGAGAQTYTYSMIQPAGLGGAAARTSIADVFRKQVTNHDYVRLFFTFTTGASAEDVEIHGGGVWLADADGSSVSASERFTNLAEAVDKLAIAGGVRLSGEFAGDRPRIVVSAPTDNTDDVTFSTDYGNVLSYKTVLAAPRTTRVLVGGSGEGTARVLRERSDSAAETEWSQRRESFVDSRDAGDNTTLDQRGDEALAENAATAGYTVEVLDRDGMAFGVDYAVGDEVSLSIDGTALTDYVAAVQVKADAEGTRVDPVLASSQLADNTPDLYQRVKAINTSVDGLERRA